MQIEITSYSAMLRGLTPDPEMTVSEWADQRRKLGATSAEPGQFKTSRTPYIREIVDHLSANSKTQRVVFKKSSQVAATEAGNNWLGYTIDMAPAAMLYVMPTDTMIKSTSKKRIQPMIDDTPTVREKVKPSKAKESSNTILEKYFEGGSVAMVGANSPVGLASAAIKLVYLDEVDRYPMDVSGEGSAISLAETRTITFGSRKKIFITSTPTKEGASAIDAEFQKTGQRYYHVPCPSCGTGQRLEFTQLRYDKPKYKEVYYECAHCGDLIPERKKPEMLSRGEWLPAFPELEDGVTFGYFINALYSPLGWYSWAQMAKEYEDSEGDTPKRVTWTNTKLGEVYREEGEVPSWESVYNRREQFRQGVALSEVAFITMGVDVQRDRLELEIVGWMKGKVSQSIDYRVLLGDTADVHVWDELGKVINEFIPREDGARLPISLTAIDSGYNSQHVYNFCRKWSPSRVIPTKGQDSQTLMVRPPQAVDVNRNGEKVETVKVWNIGVSIIKSELYGWLKQQKGEDGQYPQGYCRFPEYEASYFKGLTAETLERVINKKGYTVYQWKKTYKRNEPLDTRVYARAAAAVYGIDRVNDKWYIDMVISLKPTPENAPPPIKKKRESEFWKPKN
jgi:phage terminase large subunit GpA-like protein